MSWKEDGFRHRQADGKRITRRDALTNGTLRGPVGRPPRTISDDLRDRELAKITKLTMVTPPARDTQTVRRESYELMPSEGSYWRRPVRYD